MKNIEAGEQNYDFLPEKLKRKNPQYIDIFIKALKLSAEGRWWDIWHVEVSTANMLQMLEEEGQNALGAVLIPAIIMHDIGWSRVGEERDFNWDDPNLRMKHMAEGAKLAESILNDIGYPSEYIPEIIELIAHHDDEYLGKPSVTLKEKILRDADASFILSYPSFWKDWYIKGRPNGITPKKYLEVKKSKHGKRYTKTAQSIIDKQISSRMKEVDSDIDPENRVREIKEIAEGKKRSI